MATVPIEKSGEVSAAYATDPSVRLKEGHSIAAMKKKGLENEKNFIQKLFQFKSSNYLNYLRSQLGALPLHTLMISA